MAYNPQDHYFKKAKKEGFLARSVYKLEEIQNKHRILKPHQHILDLGCAPGSWSQYVLKVLGKTGFLFGMDLKAVTLSAPNAKFVQEDVFQFDDAKYEGHPYDVVLSDMAPNTTGIAFTDQARSEALCLKVLEVADRYLKPGGHLVMKLFQGGGSQDVHKAVKGKYQKVIMLKPQGTRKESFEIFVVGIGKK